MADPQQQPPLLVRARRPDLEPNRVVLVIGGRITRADIPRLCERVLLDGSHAEAVVCDVGTLTDPDVGTVDALARLALSARRLGQHMQLRDAPHALQQLLALTGLDDVVPPECAATARVEPADRTAGTGARCPGTRSSR